MAAAAVLRPSTLLLLFAPVPLLRCA